MNKGAMLFLAALAALAGCSSESGTGGSGGTAGTGGAGGSAGSGGMGGGDPRACATDIDVGEVQTFGDPTPLLRSEGITFDTGGRLYVSAQDPGDDEVPDQLIEVMLDGTNEEVAAAPSILGLEGDARGILAAGIGTGELLLIDPDDGTHEVIADMADGMPAAPNFVVTTPWDTILVSDDTFGEDTIYEVTWDGVVSPWVDGVPTPNGMVFSLDGTTLYVATTFTDEGLWAVPVDPDGEAGLPAKLVDFAGTAPDGVAIDGEGNVYVALNTAGQIAKVDTEGNATMLATDMTGPASLAFGQGDFDPCSLYVTSLFTTQLYRVGAGVLGVEK